MKNRAGKNTSGGFTLLEVLFASAIMAACISGLLLTYINLLTLTDLTRFLQLPPTRHRGKSRKSNGSLMAQ